MSFRRLGLALVLAMAAVSSLRGFDFTLHQDQPAGHPSPLSKTYFTDGDSKIFIELPRDWRVSGSPQTLDCVPAPMSCHVRIDQAGSRPWPFDAPGKIDLRKRALDAIPPGAKNVLSLPDQSDVVPLAGWSSLEVANTYEFYGQKMRRDVLYVNLPEHRVWQVSITTPEANFTAIHDQTRLML